MENKGTITWIRCSDRMPEPQTEPFQWKEYLVCWKYGVIQKLTYTEKGWNTFMKTDGTYFVDHKMNSDDVYAWAYINLPEGLEDEQDE